MTSKQKIEDKGENGNAARIAALEEETAKLRAQLARGTGDVTAEARSASSALPSRVEALVRVRPYSVAELAKELGEPAGRVSTALGGMRRHLYNAGSEHEPAWFWVVGDESPAVTINAAVEALIKTAPRTLPELISATGARPGRVSGAIVRLQREPGTQLINLGTPTRARWFLVPDGIKLAKLKKR